MIELKYFKESFEKLAEENISVKAPGQISKKEAFALKVLNAISRVISGGAKVVSKYPAASMLGIGAVAGGTYLAAKAWPGFSIVNETKQNRIMNDQLAYLRQMANSSSQYGRSGDMNAQQGMMSPAIQPLA
jgi:hypothetical protein